MIHVRDNKKTVRFILIGNARTGTGYLRSSIDNHPNAFCLGEILHPKQKSVRSRAHSNYFKDNEYLNLSADDENTQRTIQYLDNKIWPQCRPDFSFGFKLLYYQIDDLNLWKYLSSKKTEIRIVHIIRNPIAVYVSHQQAYLTQNWISFEGEKKSAAKPISIDIKHFLGHLNEVEKKYKQIKKISTKIEQVNYEELVMNYQMTLNRVYDFLELPPHKARSKLVKQQGWSIENRIKNFDEFSTQLPYKYRYLLENMF